MNIQEAIQDMVIIVNVSRQAEGENSRSYIKKYMPSHHDPLYVIAGTSGQLKSVV